MSIELADTLKMFHIGISEFLKDFKNGKLPSESDIESFFKVADDAGLYMLRMSEMYLREMAALNTGGPNAFAEERNKRIKASAN